MDEVWKPVPNYEDLYEVSNLGRVRSLYRYKKLLKLSPITNGYVTVELWKGKKRKRIGVHRLVAMCFCRNPENKPFVNHLDETRDNNRADNLEWVSHVENCNYGTAIARRVSHTDYTNRHAHPNQIAACSKPIAQYTKSGEFVRYWSSASECARTNGWAVSCINHNCHGDRPSAYGFVFNEVI